MNTRLWTVTSVARLWQRHPAVKTGNELTAGERAADRLRNGMGSWTFVIAALIFLFGWTIGNRTTGFDPYPFILLNLLLSCVAALQGAVLLIAARRADQVAAALALHDFETNRQALEILTDLKTRLDFDPGGPTAASTVPPDA